MGHWNGILNLPKYGNGYKTITSTAGLFQDRHFCGHPSEGIEMARTLLLAYTHTRTHAQGWTVPPFKVAKQKAPWRQLAPAQPLTIERACARVRAFLGWLSAKVCTRVPSYACAAASCMHAGQSAYLRANQTRAAPVCVHCGCGSRPVQSTLPSHKDTHRLASW